MQIEVRYGDLSDEVMEAGRMARVLFEGLSQDVRAVSFATERRVKVQMPVDTGRARASWGHWNAGDLLRANGDAGPGDAHWQESDHGLAIEQGSNVEYIGALNDGHSSQAPAGFIDMAEEQAQRELEAKVEQRLGRL